MMNRLLLALFFLWAILASALGVRIGVVTDVHYADKPSTAKRDYRASLAKLETAVAAFNEAKPDFIVELGDFIDAAPTAEGEAGHARTINAVFAQFNGPRHHVIGNHDVEALTKAQFLEVCGAKQAHYSFDCDGFHFVVLDACYTADGTPYGAKKIKWTDTEIPPAERDWLAANLKATDKKTVCFVHQRLDVAKKTATAIKNAEEIRRMLEQSGNVLAVLQGHAHTNEVRQINGIHYVTLHAMTETPGAYTLLEVQPDGTLVLSGFRSHLDRRLAPPKAQ